MKSGRIAMICRMLIVSLFFFSYHAAAGMISTEQVGAVTSAQAERTQIQNLLSRADVANQLEAYGIDVKSAQARVAVMTDEEARTLAGQLPTVPAGGDGWAVAAIVIIAAALLWWWWGRR